MYLYIFYVFLECRTCSRCMLQKTCVCTIIHLLLHSTHLCDALLLHCTRNTGKGKKQNKILYIIETRNEGVKDCVQSAVMGLVKEQQANNTCAKCCCSAKKRDWGTNLSLKYLLILQNIFLFYYSFFFPELIPSLTLVKLKYNPLKAPLPPTSFYTVRGMKDLSNFFFFLFINKKFYNLNFSRNQTSCVFFF